MDNAVLTGSQVYGIPKPDSDVDLVILISPRDIEKLRSLAEKHDGNHKDSDGGPQTINETSASLRFGRLNLICVSDPLAFEVWRRGTKALCLNLEQTGRAISRDIAVEHFDKLRDWAGLKTPEPKVMEAVFESQAKKGKAALESLGGDDFDAF